MRAALVIRSGIVRGFSILGAVVIALGRPALAQTANDGLSSDWEHYDWLKPTDNKQGQTASGATVTASTQQEVKDPFTVISNGALWQEKVDDLYSRHLSNTLLLSYETTTTQLSEASNPTLPVAGGSSDDLSRGQKVGLQYQPAQALTLGGNVHESTSDAATVGNSVVTSGAGLSAESQLPSKTDLTLGVNSDRTATDTGSPSVSTDTSYDAQIKQPLGNLPLSAQLKGHYEETEEPGLPVGKAPAMEQSLTWKPMEDTTVQMGLRQQQYQAYPGVDNEFNEALFADWSQRMAGDVTWHSYAEVLNTRGIIDQAPAAPLASGANGTQQATVPGSNTGLTSSLPISMQDQTLTFSTGPSFQLQKDISASIEYSDRWDKSPAAGNVGQEQRVSLSVKGSF